MRLLDRAVFVTLAPLALALAALGVREWTRIRTAEPATPGPATEFVPPPLFMAASVPPGREQTFGIVTDRSSGRVTRRDDEQRGGEQDLRAAGTLRILADESLADLAVELAPRGPVLLEGWPRDVKMHLRAAGERSHATDVPGVRAADLRCSVTIGADVHETSLAITWIRLPGGLVELHGVAVLPGATFELPRRWPSSMLRAEEVHVLGIDLVLHADR